jgi:vancomycin permeability regulator SanA
MGHNKKIIVNKKKHKKVFYLILGLAVLAIAIIGLPSLITEIYSKPRLFQVGSAPTSRVAIVFGAGLQRDGFPSPILKDRVATAADLYFAGKVQKILMSGDNRSIYYNEPGAMMAYAEKLGVPQKDIVLDYAGLRTYDTCYRAEYIFGIQEALLVTQRYHLPRALFTCNLIGLKSVGVIADQYIKQYYSSLPIWTLREFPASIGAMWDLFVSHPLPVLGKREPIFPENTLNQVGKNKAAFWQ